MQKAMDRNSRNDIADNPASKADNTEELFIAPFITELGPPVAFHRQSWLHAEGVLMCYEPGVPFELNKSDASLNAEPVKPFPPEVAIWMDGTIIWSKLSDAGIKEHYAGKLDHKDVDRFLASIDAEKYRSKKNIQYTQEARSDRYIPTSMIAILDGEKSFVFCSSLDQMERMKEYWYCDNGKTRNYPFARYSFQQFCDKIPQSYAQYLQDYVKLRTLLLSIIPKTGNKVDLDKRIRWVLLPVPGAKNGDKESTKDRDRNGDAIETGTRSKRGRVIETGTGLVIESYSAT